MAVDRLEVKVVEAQGLRNVESGAPSAYAEVVVGYNSYGTKYVVETNDPIWRSPAMSFAPLLGEGIETVIIYVKHKDIFTGKDSILGYASIPMSTYYNAPKVELDGWYDLLNAGQSKEIGEALGRIRTRITYFNEMDDDLVEQTGGLAKPKAPNLLEVVVIDGKDFAGGRAVEPFVIVQIGDLRKETKSSKKSKTPQWNDTVQIPIMDGDEVIDITVKNTTVVRSIFLGRIRIPLNEVAAAGEVGLRKVFTLLNENLVFEGAGNGQLQMNIRWFFDKATDDENNRVKEKRKGVLSRLASLLPFGKATKKEGEEEKKEEEKKDEEEEDDDDQMGDMTPYEYAMWLEEQRRKRREELADLLEVPEFELDFKVRVCFACALARVRACARVPLGWRTAAFLSRPFPLTRTPPRLRRASAPLLLLLPAVSLVHVCAARRTATTRCRCRSSR